MKFLVDAQLPIRLARLLSAAGYDTVHTHDLAQQNATPDADINALSIAQQQIVITKDEAVILGLAFSRTKLKHSQHRNLKMRRAIA